MSKVDTLSQSHSNLNLIISALVVCGFWYTLQVGSPHHSRWTHSQKKKKKTQIYIKINNPEEGENTYMLVDIG